MKKRNLEKIIKYIESNGSITKEECIDELKISGSESDQIFELLVNNGDVIGAISKDSSIIYKKRGSQYQSLSKTPAPSNIIYRLAKNPIIQIMSIIVIIYSFLKIVESVCNIDIPVI